MSQPEKKTDLFKVAVHFFCGAILLWMLGATAAALSLDTHYNAGQSCAGHILFGKDVIQANATGQSSMPDVDSDKNFYSIVSLVLLVLGTSCIILVNALFFMRKLILCRYGCPAGLTGYIDPWCDHRLLREIARTQASDEERLVFRWINILIPAFFIIGVVLMLAVGILLSGSQ